MALERRRLARVPHRGRLELTHAGVHVLLHPRVEYLTQIAVRWRDRDDAGRTSELVDATGGSVLFISPGIRLELTRDLWLE